jgi:hypothetical protein
VNAFKSFPNLLTWYTADEPDGSSDDPSESVAAYDTINTLDSFYHPTALVLNCKDYLFEGYVPGTDVLMADPYPIGINATFSSVWGTQVTSDFGDCGCDDCIGNFTDVSVRMDLFNQRVQMLGERKPLWGVPQGFGNDSCVVFLFFEFIFFELVSMHQILEPLSDRTGIHCNESTFYLAWCYRSALFEQFMFVLTHAHCSCTGILSWQDPTTPDIKSSASLLALALPKMTPALFNPATTFNGYTQYSLDIGVWTSNSSYLVVAVNLASSSATLDLSTFPSGDRTQVILTGVTEDGSTATFDGSGSAAWLIGTSTSSSSGSPKSKSSAAGSPLQHLMGYWFWDYARTRLFPMAMKNEL